MNTAQHAHGAGLGTPAINRLTEEVLALDRAGELLQTAATLIAVTRRSLEDRPPNPQVGAPPAEGSGEWRGHQQNGRADYHAAAEKQRATLTAKAAMREIKLQRLDGGGYLLTRWNLSKELPDLASAEALLARMGVFL